jgi:hypothetical protein
VCRSGENGDAVIKERKILVTKNAWLTPEGDGDIERTERGFVAKLGADFGAEGA